MNLSLFACSLGLILLRALFKFGAHSTAISVSYWNTRITCRFAVQPEHFNFYLSKENSVTAILQIANVVT